MRKTYASSALACGEFWGKRLCHGGHRWRGDGAAGMRRTWIL